MNLDEVFSGVSEPVSYKFPQVKDQSSGIIKVIGVGGGGGNAVKNMQRQGVENVSFAVVNTDSQALSKTEVDVKLQIGENGLGVGGRPELGREAAEYSIEHIRRLFDDNTKMVFITAGMGGGTGTGAAPVIARVARDMDILTVGVVTLPFAFEKKLRIEKALKGVEELKAEVDALLVINNERLMQIYADGMTTISDAFRKADEIVTVATKSIAEIITLEGEVNRDFCDVQTVMKNGGGALMSEGRASGEHRIMKAMANALNSPLLNNIEVQRSQRLLYIIYQSHANPVLITELNEVNQFMDNMASDLEVLWGLYWDDSLGEDVKVNIISTGFDKERPETEEEKSREAADHISLLREHYYGSVNEKEVIGDNCVEGDCCTDKESADSEETSPEESCHSDAQGDTYIHEDTSPNDGSSGSDADEDDVDKDDAGEDDADEVLVRKTSAERSWMDKLIDKAKEMFGEEWIE